MAWAAVLASTAAAAGAGGLNMSDERPAELSPEKIRERSVAHRTAEVTLTVAGPDGEPLAGAAVTVR
jgi:hypothetical protein